MPPVNNASEWLGGGPDSRQKATRRDTQSKAVQYKTSSQSVWLIISGFPSQIEQKASDNTMTQSSALSTPQSKRMMLDLAERDERWKPVPSSSEHRACLPVKTTTNRRVVLGFVVVMEFPICVVDSAIVTGMFSVPNSPNVYTHWRHILTIVTLHLLFHVITDGFAIGIHSRPERTTILDIET